MPSWNDLLAQIASLPDDDARSKWVGEEHVRVLHEIGKKRGGRNVISYSSAFLQKPNTPPWNLQITHEDLNGFMSVMYGMDWSKGLTLILHTPGGVLDATETLVSYIHQKFAYVEVIVPAMAMSAGTMVSLSSQCIVMGPQSQLGPIDPQMPYNGRTISAYAVVEQFKKARSDVKDDPTTAHLWAPIVQSLGPSLLQEAENAVSFSETMVRNWLAARMFAGQKNAARLARAAAKHFNDATKHKSHGHRIDRAEAKAQRLNIEDLENDQELQDLVLTAYHLCTITFEKSIGTKEILSDSGRMWMKNWKA